MFNKKLSQKNEERKFVGANVPLQVSSYLSLYALCMQTSKSGLITEAILLWQERAEKTTPEPLLIDSLMIVIKAQFVADTPKKGDSSFVSRLKKELEKKGIENRVIDAILKRFLDETKQ